MPCLHFSLSTDTLPVPRRAWPRPLAALALSLGGAGLGLAAAAATLAAPASAPSAAATPTATEADLVQRARSWLSVTQQVSPAAVTVQPPDARLKVGACASGWVFDKPYAQNEGVLRARCPDSQWQLFLAVNVARPAASGPAGQVAASAQAAPATPASLPPPAPTLAAYPAPGAAAASPLSAPSPGPTPVTTWTPGGQAAPAAASATPLVVRRGHTVLTTWSPAPGLEVSARLESLDDGRIGDTIRVRNRDTGRILGAQVSGPNQAVGQ